MTEVDHGIGLRAALRVWASVGLHSFGGPAGQIAVMHREIVERRRWVSDGRFMHALNACMLVPGPEAMQLATYLGWLMHGIRGGLAAGTLFVLPGFAVMLGLSMAYVAFGSVSWVTGLFAGLQAAVVMLVAVAFARIARRSWVTRGLAVIGVASFLAVLLWDVPFPLIVVVAGAVGWLGLRSQPSSSESSHLASEPALADQHGLSPGKSRRARKAALACLVLWLAPVAAVMAVLGPGSVLGQIAWLFSKAAILTFGGAYAILGYVAQEAVGHYGWLTSADMATGLALAETTPGPLLLVLSFIGFVAAHGAPDGLPPMAAGVIGATLAAWVTFVPAFMIVFAMAPSSERLRQHRAVAGALAAITAAVCGVILDLALWFASHVLFASVGEVRFGPIHLLMPDLATTRWAMVLIAVIASGLLATRRVPTLAILGVCAVTGAGVMLIGGTG
ncbi:MAG: chromate efflux transporter [Actinomycetales bacterium]|nr:chromate efflux transporter [Actinomycetales bacterium]